MPSFKFLGHLVLEKIFFKVFNIYGHGGGHLGHVTWTIYMSADLTKGSFGHFSSFYVIKF